MPFWGRKCSSILERLKDEIELLGKKNNQITHKNMSAEVEVVLRTLHSQATETGSGKELHSNHQSHCLRKCIHNLWAS